MSIPTPSQTVGPFFAYGLTPTQYGYPMESLASPSLVDDNTDGERIRIEGRVLDGEGQTIPDAMIEIWQADADGRYAHPDDPRRPNAAFRGFGRTGTGTDPQDRYWFDTIKPGAPQPGDAPHVNLIVFMRGLLRHAYTRAYFNDHAEANENDPILTQVPVERRHTLIARRQVGPRGTVYVFDIHMQGKDETVLFAL